jgi:regulator of cell morphogenesis and NO signaling
LKLKTFMKIPAQNNIMENESVLNLDGTVSEIVRSDYRTADVFKKLGINYCCSGTITLLEACSARGLDFEMIRKSLLNATRNIRLSNSLQFNQWKIEFLIDYIINVHHAYLKSTLTDLETALLLFVEGHNKKYPDMEGVLRGFHELSEALEAHNKYEEEVIFPYIKQIESMFTKHESYGNLFVRTLRKPLATLENDNEKIRELLSEIQALTHNYTPPSNSCTNHHVIYRRLNEFHNDLVQHKHLENNILYPRALEMELQMLQL